MARERFSDLQGFLALLEERGELRRIRAEVDPELEITEIASRVIEEQGPALLFENVRGADLPLVINLFGTEERVELALGCKPRRVGEELVELFERLQPPSLRALFASLPQIARLRHMRVRTASKGRVQEVVEPPALTRLPAIKCWPLDGGRFITLGLVQTERPVGGGRNVGVYRMQIFDDETTGMHWHPHKGGAAHYHEAARLGRPLEAAVVLGGDPRLIFSAIAPLPDGMDEVAFAGYLRGEPIPMVKARTLGMRVPADAELVIEGVVPQGERCTEGPFGDHFGYYSMEAQFPVFRARLVTRRRNAVYPATVVGKPPKEDVFLGMAAAEMFSPLVRIVQPEVKDMWAYPEAGFHNLLVVSVDERYPRGGVKAMLALWGTGQLLLTKCMVTVSSDVDPRDFGRVVEEIGRNFDPREDFLLIPWAPLDTLDFTSGRMHVGSKMGINATRRSSSRPGVPPPANVVPDPRGKLPRVLDWRLLPGGMLHIKVREHPRETIEELFQVPGYDGVRIVVAQSEDIDLADDGELIWGMFTRFDPYLDVFFERTTLRGSAVQYEGRMGVDATMKKWYPPVIEMSAEVVERVSARWKELWSG